MMMMMMMMMTMIMFIINVSIIIIIIIVIIHHENILNHGIFPLPVVPARGGAEVALNLIVRPFSSIELARAVRRACLLCANLLCCCCPKTWPACDHCGTQHQETCTAHLPPDLMSNHLISSDICPLTSTHPIFPTHRQPDSFFLCSISKSWQCFRPALARKGELLTQSVSENGRSWSKAGTLHEKTQGFLPRLSPKTKPMQHSCSHYIAFCNIRFQTRISQRTWQHITTTIMHPFHCDMQPERKLTHHHSLSIVSHFSSWCDVK